MSFSKAAIKRFNDEQGCAPAPTTYNPNFDTGNVKTLPFEGYSGRDSKDTEFAVPDTPGRGRKTVVSNFKGSSRSNSRSTSRTRSGSTPRPNSAMAMAGCFGLNKDKCQSLEDVNKINDLEMGMKKLELNLAEVGAQKQDQEAELEATMNCLELKTELVHQLSAEIDKLLRIQEMLKQEKEDAINALIEKENAVQAFTLERESASKMLQEKKTELEATMNSLEVKTELVQQLETENDKLLKIQKSLKQENEDAINALIIEKENAVQAFTLERESASKMLQEKKAELEATMNSLELKTELVQQLETENDKLLKIQELLKQEKEDANNTLMIKETALNEVRERWRNERRSYSTVLEENDHLRAENAKLAEDYALAIGHSNHHQKIRHVLNLKDENQKYKQEVVELRERNAKLMTEITKLQKKWTHSGSGGSSRFDKSQAFKHNVYIPETGDLRGPNSRETFVVSKKGPLHTPAPVEVRVRPETMKQSAQGYAFEIDFEEKENIRH